LIGARTATNLGLSVGILQSGKTELEHEALKHGAVKRGNRPRLTHSDRGHQRAPDEKWFRNRCQGEIEIEWRLVLMEWVMG